EKRSKDEQGSEADAADFASVRGLFQKGLAPSSRLADARRAALMSSEQLLQTVSGMADIERQRDEYARQLQQIDTQMRIDDLQKLQQANLRIAELRTNLKGIGDKLVLVGRLRTDATIHANLAVYRKDTNGSQRVVAGEDLELVPGDVVEVVLPHDTGLGMVASAANLH
ncbi:MAG TPA: hypothetical protein PLD10_26200, partial [Rhodopila sp.]|nr:hypothetical protein [Rhodopila sp.]